ncbi:Protein ArsC [compost metagenome]
MLQAAGVNTEGFHSKSWDEFSTPPMHVVITVCDSAAQEACPYWPGTRVKVHWGYPDPSNTEGGDAAKRQAFELTRQAISYRMLQLLALDNPEAMSDAELQERLTRISAS